jgi:hypothetical protein
VYGCHGGEANVLLIPVVKKHSPETTDECSFPLSNGAFPLIIPLPIQRQFLLAFQNPFGFKEPIF